MGSAAPAMSQHVRQPLSLPFEPDAYFANLEAKRDAFMDGRDEIDTVIVGSSHGEYGLDPEHIDGSFNLCTASQDIRQSASMYAWATRRNRQLRRVIVFYSLFSYGFDCSRSSDHARCVFLRRAFGVRWDEDLDDLLWSIDLNARWPHQPLLPPAVLDRGFIRSNARDFFSEAPDALARRVSRHVAMSEVQHQRADQLPHLAAIITLAKRRGDEVVVVVPPMRSDYLAALPHGASLFDKLRALCARGRVQLVEAFADPAFAWEDFGDPDHLYPAGEGPKKLADLVRGRLASRRPARVGYVRAMNHLREAVRLA